MKKRIIGFAAALGVALALCAFQRPRTAPQGPGEDDVQLPNGKSQQQEILKADHQKDLKDAAQLVDLAEQLKAELEKNDQNVLSISSIKKTEEIEKIAKRIRARIRH
jgi:hypothetical protein